MMISSVIRIQVFPWTPVRNYWDMTFKTMRNTLILIFVRGSPYRGDVFNETSDRNFNVWLIQRLHSDNKFLTVPKFPLINSVWHVSYFAKSIYQII